MTASGISVLPIQTRGPTRPADVRHTEQLLLDRHET